MLFNPSILKLKNLSLAIVSSISLLCISAAPTHVFAADTPTEQTTNASEESPFSKLDWHIGPSTEHIANVAVLKTQQDEGFLDTQNSDEFLKLTDNLPSGSTNILVATDNSWWATFDFDPSGYVKDDEKIDADALLKELKSTDEASNEERERLGIPKLYTEGWAIPPHYDPVTKRLEWALKLKSDQGETINYTVRLLGRTGVVSATLVSDEQELQQNIQAFKKTLEGFDFDAGQRYTEYRAGDKVAEYGLAALVTGGVVAAAAKKGFFASLLLFLAKGWKIVTLGAIALLGGLRSLFKRKKSE